MTRTKFLKTAGVITAFTAIIIAGMMNSSKRVSARDDETGNQTEESRIQRGFAIAPVHVNRSDIETTLNPGFLSLVTGFIVTRTDAFRTVHHSRENYGSECRDDSRGFQELGACHGESPQPFSNDLKKLS